MNRTPIWGVRLGEKLMSNSRSEIIESTLRAEDVHLGWEKSYHTEDNVRFFEEALDHVLNLLNPPKGSAFLDAGCGTCVHSVYLARRGFYIQAIDYSENVLRLAKSRIRSCGYDDKIKLRRENILCLPYPNEQFDYILCWGVLMHIPDIEKAISELARVVKRNGAIVVSEGNMVSLESLTTRVLKAIVGKKDVNIKKTKTGFEYWTRTTAGELFYRHANIPWLINAFEKRGLIVKNRLPGQFTEFYTRFSSRSIKRLIHSFNHLWFKYTKIPYFPFGNILILQKLT